MDYKKYSKTRKLNHWISGPFIWAPLIAVIILDLFISLYQFICFPLYGIKKVRREAYIQILDRNKLRYLSLGEKIGCMYCGYVNGFLLYAKEIAGLTEKYWCGIMHQDKPGFQTQTHQLDLEFAAFNDQKDFQTKYEKH